MMNWMRCAGDGHGDSAFFRVVSQRHETVSGAAHPTDMQADRSHVPEYLIEGALLGVFMLAACGFSVLLNHPASFVVQAIPGESTRRAMMGVAMGLTAMALIYSPLGRRSGAHMNPATTLTFWRLGKIAGGDMLGYVLAQCFGAVAAVQALRLGFGMWLGEPHVNYAATVPGPWGWGWAWCAEVGITFVLMTVILQVSNRARWARYTGVCAGTLVFLYITFEAPVSGMSMNPARSLGSALAAGAGSSLWIYFTAPPVGMLLAAEVYVRMRGLSQVYCCKMDHGGTSRCIFRCRYGEMRAPAACASPGAAPGIKAPDEPGRSSSSHA